MATIPALPVPKPQIDGTYYQQANCVASVAAEAADRASGGRWNLTPAQVRRASGVTAYRGLSDSEAADAIVRLTSGEVVLLSRRLATRGEFRALIASGRGAGVRINCAVTVNTTRRTNYFRGLHEVYVNDDRQAPNGGCMCEKRLQTQHAEYLVEDPGTTRVKWLWWSADLLYRAAESAGGGAIFVLMTRDTENVSRSVRLHPAAFPRKGPSLSFERTRSKPLPKGMVVLVRHTREGGSWTYYGHAGNGWALVRLPDTGKERWLPTCFLR